jgi:hypothetical protein
VRPGAAAGAPPRPKNEAKAFFNGYNLKFNLFVIESQIKLEGGGLVRRPGRCRAGPGTRERGGGRLPGQYVQPDSVSAGLRMRTQGPPRSVAASPVAGPVRALPHHHPPMVLPLQSHPPGVLVTALTSRPAGWVYLYLTLPWRLMAGRTRSGRSRSWRQPQTSRRRPAAAARRLTRSRAASRRAAPARPPRRRPTAVAAAGTSSSAAARARTPGRPRRRKHAAGCSALSDGGRTRTPPWRRLSACFHTVCTALSCVKGCPVLTGAAIRRRGGHGGGCAARQRRQAQALRAGAARAARRRAKRQTPGAPTCGPPRRPGSGMCVRVVSVRPAALRSCTWWSCVRAGHPEHLNATGALRSSCSCCCTRLLGHTPPPPPRLDQPTLCLRALEPAPVCQTGSAGARAVAAEEDSSDEEDAPRARREPAEYVGPSAGCTAVRARPARPPVAACDPCSPA